MKPFSLRGTWTATLKKKGAHASARLFGWQPFYPSIHYFFGFLVDTYPFFWFLHVLPSARCSAHMETSSMFASRALALPSKT